jgi:hypothetical protein
MQMAPDTFTRHWHFVFIKLVQVEIAARTATRNYLGSRGRGEDGDGFLKIIGFDF